MNIPHAVPTATCWGCFRPKIIFQIDCPACQTRYIDWQCSNCEMFLRFERGNDACNCYHWEATDPPTPTKPVNPRLTPTLLDETYECDQCGGRWYDWRDQCPYCELPQLRCKDPLCDGTILDWKGHSGIFEIGSYWECESCLCLFDSNLTELVDLELEDEDKGIPN